MAYGTDRILTTHAGALPRSPGLTEKVYALASGKTSDERAVKKQVQEETQAVVRRQAACGIDIVNDGEIGKPNFTAYVRQRVSGFELKSGPRPPGTEKSIIARDMKRFSKFFEKSGGWVVEAAPNFVCVEELQYVGTDALAEDIANFRSALAETNVFQAFLPAVTPGSIEHWLRNEYYATDEAFLFGIADAMRPEYEAIVEAGFQLQIDNPDLADGWQMYPDMTIPEYRKYAELRVAALNHGVRNIPREKIRMHMCWGSNHGPHQNDLPLSQIVDILFKAKAGSYSIEASNPVHEHEWKVFETARLPDGSILIPGVVGHATDFIEHPEAICDRILRYANLVGRDNIAAGTDCGLGPRVGHSEIAWAKLESLAEGARLATKKLWP